MQYRQKRAHKRYVVGGLMVDIGGVTHETIDVSRRAIALVHRAGVDYAHANPPYAFRSASVVELNQPIKAIKFFAQRGHTVVLEYDVPGTKRDNDAWEQILCRHDVRADIAPLEPMFG